MMHTLINHETSSGKSTLRGIWQNNWPLPFKVSQGQGRHRQSEDQSPAEEAGRHGNDAIRIMDEILEHTKDINGHTSEIRINSVFQFIF